MPGAAAAESRVRDGAQPLTIVVDAISALPGSQVIVTEYILRAWRAVGPDDEVHLVVGDDIELRVPDWVVAHRVGLRRPRQLGRLTAQIGELRRICRQTGADVLFASVPASALADVSVPRVLLLHDLRHELRPEQFGRVQRWARKLIWGYNFRVASAVACVSERTRQDLLRHRGMAGKAVVVAHLGADHVDGWPTPERDEHPYALACGHFANKNADVALAAWAALAQRGETLPLKVTGVPPGARADLEARAVSLGIAQQVEFFEWLPEDAFRALFAGADLLVFPSDFEGFGLPVAEAMRLGKRVIISADPALIEITGGHATVAAVAAEPLADAVAEARRRTQDELAASRRFAERYQWVATAQVLRDALLTAARAGR